jgi:hypothetical protein
LTSQHRRSEGVGNAENVPAPQRASTPHTTQPPSSPQLSCRTLLRQSIEPRIDSFSPSASTDATPDETGLRPEGTRREPEFFS